MESCAPNEQMRKIFGGWTGHDEFENWLKLFGENFEITSMEFKDIIGNDEVCYLTRTYEGKMGGKPIPRNEAHLKYVFVDGKIIYCEDKWDTAAFIKAMSE